MTERRNGLFFAGLLLAAVVIAVGLSQFSSDNPDGLEFVAEQEGFADSAEEGAGAPLADYGQELSDNEGLNTAVAGIAGVLVTLGLGYGLFWLVRRRRPDDAPPAAAQ